MISIKKIFPYRTIIYDPYLKNHTWIIYDIFFMNYVRKWPLSYMKSGPLHTWIMLRFYMSHGIILTKITYGSYIWHIWKFVDYIWIMYDKLLKTHNNHVWFLHMSYMNHTWLSYKFCMKTCMKHITIMYGLCTCHIWTIHDYAWIMYENCYETYNHHACFMHMSYVNHTWLSKDYVWNLFWNI